MEEWRPIKGFEGYYEVSNLGRVRSVDRQITTKRIMCNGEPSISHYTGRILKPHVSISGNGPRLTTALKMNNKMYCKTIASLVAQAFLGNPYPQAIVKFKDGNRLNCHVNNLYYKQIHGTDKNSTGIRDKKKRHKFCNGKKVVQISDGFIFMSVQYAAMCNNTTPAKISYDANTKQKQFRFL